MFSDRVTRLLFHLGPRIYGWSVGAGPEVPLRREFAAFASAGRAAGRLLDLGCGPGFFAEDATGSYWTYVGADRSLPMLRHARRFLARRRLPGGLVAASAFELPFRDGSFDLVAACDLVYLVADPVATLREMARVARPGGTVATLDPSDAMSKKEALAWCRAQRLSPVDTFRIVFWASAAVHYRRYDERSRRAEFVAAGLPDPEVRRTMGGLVLLARAETTAPPRG